MKEGIRITDKKPLDDATNQGSPSDDELDTNGDGSDAEQATDEVWGETLDFANTSAGRSELEQLTLKLTESENHALRTHAELDHCHKRAYPHTS